MKIPFLSRLLEIKEKQLIIENNKVMNQKRMIDKLNNVDNRLLDLKRILLIIEKRIKEIK